MLTANAAMKVKITYCKHIVQLGFVNVFNVPINLIYFFFLNSMHLHWSVYDVVNLQFCSKWAANESDLPRFCKELGGWRNERPLFS